jgi:membrane-associated phospholipid phosphatase
MSFAAFMRENDKLGLRIYTQTQNNNVLKIVAEILSFTSDEVIWFGLPGIVGCVIFSIRIMMGTYTMGCFEEAVWDCFGSSMVGTFFESILKLIFRTTRPYYAKQSTFHSILGEVYSFPSGHTLRGFYWMFWLTRNRFVRLFIHLPRARYFLPWAIGVGWSRVAKGKHWPIDVFAGAIVGSVLGYIVEDYLGVHARGVLKTVAGTFSVHL